MGSTAAADLPREFSGVTSEPIRDDEMEGVPGAGHITRTDGTDGVSMSQVERYAALEFAYQLLDFRDGDFIIPCGAYHDAPNIVTGTEDDDADWSELVTGDSTSTEIQMLLL